LWKTYGIKLYDMEEINNVDAIVFAVPHEEFQSIKLEDIQKMYNNKWNNQQEAIKEIAVTADEEKNENKYVLIDVKGIFDRKEAEKMNFQYWRL
ncbi:MAG: nucleotide sugar dehydrogenase, partial [Clostridiales bacterium]|nr:nucleotide sugar dehydrogenase [Clostridiales bacterium]